ncbi:MAG: hypothetical protein V5A22_07425, partial [Salinivenus sp.]
MHHWTPLILICAGLLALAGACSSDPGTETGPPPSTPDLETGPFLDTVQARTFDFFWETTNAENGLTP